MPAIDLANPTRFLAFSGRLLPWLWGLTGAALLAGLYLSFFVAPADYQQGEMVRIMFIHVPFAWIAMACYGVMTVAALGTLVWRHPLADVLQKSAAPLGAAFTFLALVTGSLWGKPTWGTYWVWDARLTSVLILFLIYLGLIALWQAVEDPGKAGARRGDPDVGRGDQPAHHQVLRRLVEHPPPAGQRLPPRRADDPSLAALASPHHGGGDHAPFRLASGDGDAERDPPPPRPCHADRRRRRMIENGAHAGFIIAAYAVTVLVLVAMLGWIVSDGRAQRRRIADLEARGIRRRSSGAKPS
jgi:heme exporter protein CcmD